VPLPDRAPHIDDISTLLDGIAGADAAGQQLMAEHIRRRRPNFVP
jgi:hypothetical protein